MRLLEAQAAARSLSQRAPVQRIEFTGDGGRGLASVQLLGTWNERSG